MQSAQRLKTALSIHFKIKMNVRISGIVKESIVDGKGIRTAIFLQGCPHHCVGCHNPQTHDPTGGTEMTTDEIMKPVFSNIILDGITLTGGDPFMQPKEAGELARLAKEHGLNVWTYTGYTFEEILKSENDDWINLLKLSDVLIDGKFEKPLRTLDKPFVGSSNQRVIDVKRSIESGKVEEIEF